MRKVRFIIDDLKYFKQKYHLSDEQMKDIFKDKESFKAIYTLIGEGKQPDKYELTDFSENPICINSINGYQRGIVLNDCYAYFAGGKYFEEDSDTPCGVVKIEETDV